MSRSGYSDDGDDETSTWGFYRHALNRAIRGKRRQAFLREMAEALDAMPVKELIAGDIVDQEGRSCAIGTVAIARKLDVSKLEPTDQDAVGKAFGVAPALAREIAYTNDDDFGPGDKTAADRWKRVRAWVAQEIRQALPSGSAD